MPAAARHAEAGALGEIRMTWMDNFVQATVIMCLGMGLVFLFVSTLIVLIRCSARILANYPDEDAAAASPAARLTCPQGAAAGISGSCSTGMQRGGTAHTSAGVAMVATGK